MTTNVRLERPRIGHLANLSQRLMGEPRVLASVLVGSALLASLLLGTRSSTILVLLVYSGIGMVVLARWTWLGLPALVLAGGLVPFTVGTGTQSSINVVIVILGGLTVFWVLRMLVWRDLSLWPSEANRPWMAIVVAAGFSIVAGSALWSPWVTVGGGFYAVQLAQWAIIVLSASAFWLMGNLVHDRRSLQYVVAIMIVFGGVFLLSRVTPGFRFLSNAVLYDGAVFRVWVVSLAAALALLQHRMRRELRFLLLGVAVAVILVSQQTQAAWQSGWIPPLVSIGTVAFVRLGRAISRFAALLAAPLALIFMFVLLPAVAAAERWSFDTRIIAWRGLLQLMEDRWLFGLGLASYWHYWRGVIGSMSYLDPVSGYLHYTYAPQVNMHNNYIDIVGQMGIVGFLAFVWLIVALAKQIRRQYVTSQEEFEQAYVAACAGGLAGMLFAGLLADWMFPFVYNTGLDGFRDSYLGWLLLGGLVLLEATRQKAVRADADGTSGGGRS